MKQLELGSLWNWEDGLEGGLYWRSHSIPLSRLFLRGKGNARTNKGHITWWHCMIARTNANLYKWLTHTSRFSWVDYSSKCRLYVSGIPAKCFKSKSHVDIFNIFRFSINVNIWYDNWITLSLILSDVYWIIVWVMAMFVLDIDKVIR